MGQLKEIKLQAYKVVATVRPAMTMVESLEGCNQLTPWNFGDLVIQMSCELDTWVEEYALKSTAPSRSRVFTKADVLEWTIQIQTANADKKAALLCAV